MKKLILLIIVMLFLNRLYAQDNIFILVDVSGSIKQTELNNSKQLVKELCAGNQINNSLWEVRGGTLNTNPLINSGDRLMIMPLGSSSTIMNYSPNIITIGSVQDAINHINQVFNFTPNNANTYLKLALARVAEIAKKNGIDKYQLITISDDASDDYGPNGLPNYTSYEQSLVDEYATQNNPVVINSNNAVSIKLRSNIRFTIKIGEEYDISNYNPPKSNSNQALKPQTNICKIKLTSYKEHTNKAPFILKSNKFTISWSCNNPPKNASYKVQLIPQNIPNEKVKSEIVSENNCNFSNISEGKWKIVVSPASLDFKANSDWTYVEIPTVCSNWWWLLILIPIGALGYWYWKKIQRDKLKKLNSLSGKDTFSNNSTLNTNSDNSVYF